MQRGFSHKGFTLVELMVVIAVIGILAAISIPNYSRYRAMADRAALFATLKYLMDGEDFYFAENGVYFPESGTFTVPKREAKEIPELAYHFPEGHKNRYVIWTGRGRLVNYCAIWMGCDFDSDGNGEDDIFRAYSGTHWGGVERNREIVQLR
ncbi:MAG: prepilin-type N-terminal cleavage/methylation domain-containing protein [Deltaproteobacteria bacterium]|nr:prepilin-type N-terminal cleavage/methylation domain-containing protein [Deltaproteobacteria bacterium]